MTWRCWTWACRSRRALGNLAHALKTPLTVLTQLAQQPRTRAQPALYQELDCQTQTLRRLIDRELKRARIAGSATPGRRVDLAREAADLVDTLQRIYRDRPLAFRVDIPPGSPFPGDRDDLLELLSNLLDNACKWAAGNIRLTARNAPRNWGGSRPGWNCRPEALSRGSGYRGWPATGAWSGPGTGRSGR